MKDRITPQARMVLGVLSESCCHLTADEVLSRLDGIGTATVYRALEHLTQMGLVRRLSVGRKSAVYELVRSEHMHFVCSDCGKVYDIAADLSGMVREAARCNGHEVVTCEVTGYGLCSSCLTEQRAAQNENNQQ